MADQNQEQEQPELKSAGFRDVPLFRETTLERAKTRNDRISAAIKKAIKAGK